MEPRKFAGPVTEHAPALLMGTFYSELGSVVAGMGISYGCFDEVPPVGELILVSVWTEPSSSGDVFRQRARALTDEEKAQLEGLGENDLGEWIRTREV